MTSTENSVWEPPNMKIFWGRIQTPLKVRAFGTCGNAPRNKKPSYSPIDVFFFLSNEKYICTLEILSQLLCDNLIRGSFCIVLTPTTFRREGFLF